MFATHSAVCSLVFSTRSAVGRGSPIRPVDPPTRQMTRCPARWRWRSTTSWTRLPKCSDGAVGSNPQYAVIGPSASAVRSADSSVVCATSPRHCSSSRMSLTGRSLRPCRAPTGRMPCARHSLPRRRARRGQRLPSGRGGCRGCGSAPRVSRARRRARRRCSRRPSRARRATRRGCRAARAASPPSP